jgi:hypothetical protein
MSTLTPTPAAPSPTSERVGSQEADTRTGRRNSGVAGPETARWISAELTSESDVGAPGFVEEQHCRPVLLLVVEAVAQRNRAVFR